MSERIAQNDIYNENGVLLIAKGHIITDETMRHLKKLGTLHEAPQPHVENQKKAQQCMANLKKTFFSHNDISYGFISRIVIETIFQSKSSSWFSCINALSNYVDWLYTHSIDVAMISLTIASQLHFDSAKMKEICLGALLHDIGKLLVPKAIIEKPCGLTKSETLIVRQHCELGVSIVKGFGLPQTCTNIILYHHERLDGSGYPYGLAEDRIPPEARIAMIADVLDAMTSYRPYKPPKSLEDAIDELKSSPEKYDPDYLGALIKAIT